MKTIIVLLAGLSVCVAHSHDQCSAQQAAVVAQQWTSAFADETHLRQFAHAFFTRFFGECPEALQLFDGDGDTSSSEFRAHATRVITSLQEEIDHLQEHDSSEHKHEEDAPLSNTTPTINTAFKAALLETLPDFVGDEMDVTAWSGCLEQIISCILH